MNKYNKFFLVLGTIGLFLMLTGVTFSFFNYTRTGAVNNLGTGRIYFNADYGLSLNITNIFPMTATEAGEANLDSVTVGIVGDTTYTDGEEFLISLVDVNNTVNGKYVPINYIATYEATTGNTIGESSATYFEAKNAKDATIYKLNATGEVAEGKYVLVGYIDNGETGINGTLTIKAYIDSDRVKISDTYYGNAPTPAPTGPNDEYGTSTSWAEGKVVLTTDEWNSLRTNPISFKIRAESNEGLWVDDEPTPSSCFTYDLQPKYVINENGGVTACTNKYTEMGYEANLKENETIEGFCNGTSSLNGMWLSDILDNANNNSYQINFLLDANAIVQVGNFAVITDYDASCGASVVIPKMINNNDVSYIGNGAFWGKQLTSIILPDGLKYIGAGSFGDNSLTDVSIPDSVVSVGNNAFAYNLLTNIKFSENQRYISESFSNQYLTRVVIPDSVTEMDPNAFSNNQITEVIIGKGLNSFSGGWPFSGNPVTTLKIDRPCSEIKTWYRYPWGNMNDFGGYIGPTGGAIYGSNDEVCDTF